MDLDKIGKGNDESLCDNEDVGEGGIGQHLLMASSSAAYHRGDNTATVVADTASNGVIACAASDTEPIMTGLNIQDTDDDECGGTTEEEDQHLLSPIPCVATLSRNAS